MFSWAVRFFHADNVSCSVCLLLRRNWQGDDRYSFLDQIFCFLGRRYSPDVADGGHVVMDFAGFLGKAVADILAFVGQRGQFRQDGLKLFSRELLCRALFLGNNTLDMRRG